MISEKVVKALCEQVNLEYVSAYLYLDMSIEMDCQYLKGYSKWLFIQYEEELKHAERILDFLRRRFARTELKDIKMQKLTVKTPLGIAKAAYEHEVKVSTSIDKIYELAIKEKDYASASFLQWFLDEQVEEEEITKDVVDMLERAGTDEAAILGIDRHLGKREE